MGSHDEFNDCVILNRVRTKLRSREMNWISCFGGPPGLSKSWSAMSVCLYIDPNFGPKNICFNALQFMRLINSGVLPPGSAILYDDPTDYNSREAMKKRNRNLSRILQTFREMSKYALVFTIPVIGWLDPAGRALFNTYFEAMSIDYENRIARMRVFDVQYNARIRKAYFKRPSIRNKYGKKPKVKYIEVEAPPSDLVKEYKALKRAHLQALNERIEREMVEEEDKDNGRTEKAADKETKEDIIAQAIKNAMREDGTVPWGTFARIAHDLHTDQSTVTKINTKRGIAIVKRL